MTQCDHVGHRVFTHRRVTDGTGRLCVQCVKCKQAVKHNDKHWLKIEDIPKNRTIHP